MWGLVLLCALSAAQDPVRIGVMALLISRPRPMHNLFAYWLGLMATGFGAGLAALFLLHDFLLPVVRVMTSVAASPVVPPAQIALGALALSTAALLTVRTSMRQPAHVTMAGSGLSARMLQPKPQTVSPRLSWYALLQGRSLGMAFVAGLCTSTQVLECGAAMIAILAAGAGAGTKVSAALMFSLVAFAIVEIPLISCLASPTKTQVVVMRLHDWLRTHRRTTFLVVLGVVGMWMVISGMGSV